MARPSTSNCSSPKTKRSSKNDNPIPVRSSTQRSPKIRRSKNFTIYDKFLCTLRQKIGVAKNIHMKVREGTNEVLGFEMKKSQVSECRGPKMMELYPKKLDSNFYKAFIPFLDPNPELTGQSADALIQYLENDFELKFYKQFLIYEYISSNENIFNCFLKFSLFYATIIKLKGFPVTFKINVPSPIHIDDYETGFFTSQDSLEEFPYDPSSIYLSANDINYDNIFDLNQDKDFQIQNFYPTYQKNSLAYDETNNLLNNLMTDFQINYNYNEHFNYDENFCFSNSNICYNNNYTGYYYGKYGQNFNNKLLF